MSDLGRVRSTVTDRVRITRPNTHGYMAVHLHLAGKRKNCRVHVLIARTFLGPRPDGMDIRHLDGDRLNNQLSNLAYGTPTENAHDTLNHGHNVASARTRCPRGHEYSAENTYVHDGSRYCRQCARIGATEPITCPRCHAQMCRKSLAKHQTRRVCWTNQMRSAGAR